MRSELKAKTLELLDKHRIMTVATLRPDGWPQATVVGFVHKGLTLYFICGRDSQKAANIARDSRLSIAIGGDTNDPMAIDGLSMAARATPVHSDAEIKEVIRLLIASYPEYMSLPSPDYSEIAVMRAIPEVISVLDYSKGFGHTDLVEVEPGDLAA
jgi:general stress protein 26